MITTLNFKPGNLKLHLDDGLHDLGPDALAVTPVGGMAGGTGGLILNGTDSYASVGAVSDLTFVTHTSVFTLAAWFKFNSLAKSQPIFRTFAQNSNFSSGFAVGWSTSQDRFSALAYRGEAASATFVAYSPVAVVPDTAWHQVMVAGSALGTYKFYVDGVEYAAEDVTTGALSVVDHDLPLRLGWLEASGPAYIWADARYRGVRAWNVALSASEVAYIYATESRWPDFQ